MTERTEQTNTKVIEQTNPYEHEEKVQQTLDAYVKLGSELSAQSIPDETLAREFSRGVGERLMKIAQNGIDLSPSTLRVGGPSVSMVNFNVIPDEDPGTLDFTTSVNAKHPTRPLGMFEERLFRARTVGPSVWEDEEVGCWRVGVKLYGEDITGTMINQIVDENGIPLLTSRTQAHMTVNCNEFTQIESDVLARRREREESLTGLRGRVSGGIVRLLRVIDQAMTYNDSADYVQLKKTQNLRILGKYGMSIGDPRIADLLNTAIGKVLNREAGIIVAGRSYQAHNQPTDSMHKYSTVNGFVADVIPSIPIATENPVGPSLVMVMRDGKLDDPQYVPLKDIQQLQY